MDYFSLLKLLNASARTYWQSYFISKVDSHSLNLGCDEAVLISLNTIKLNKYKKKIFLSSELIFRHQATEKKKRSGKVTTSCFPNTGTNVDFLFSTRSPKHEGLRKCQPHPSKGWHRSSHQHPYFPVPLSFTNTSTERAQSIVLENTKQLIYLQAPCPISQIQQWAIISNHKNPSQKRSVTSTHLLYPSLR